MSPAFSSPAPLSDGESAVQSLALALRAAGWRLATAESCTGGLIAAACTALAGSSEWFERGFVTYSNQAKTDMLGVAETLLDAHGAVSAEVAQAMARGALQHSRADLAVAVTGIAGPGGAVPGKPVGTVWLGLAWRGAALGVDVNVDSHGAISTRTELLQLGGDRNAVRAQTVQLALQRLLALAAAAKPAPA